MSRSKLTGSLVEGIADAFRDLHRPLRPVLPDQDARQRGGGSALPAGTGAGGRLHLRLDGSVVDASCAQQFQHFISNSPWDHEPVLAQISQDADRLLGGKPTSSLIIDESSFAKQGDRSVGVARQWSGRLGKVAFSPASAIIRRHSCRNCCPSTGPCILLLQSVADDVDDPPDHVPVIDPW